MTIRHLNVFIKVCECGYSISKASEQLCVAQPSVSQTIKELEEYYGVVLFNRANRKLLLTKEGELILNKAKEVVASFEEFENIAGDKRLNPVVKVGATGTFGMFIIPKYIEKLKLINPKIEPLIMVDIPAALEEEILLGNLDFALIEGLFENDYLNAYCVGEDELIGVVSNDFDIPDVIDIKDIVKYPLLIRRKNNPSRKMLEDLLESKNIKFPVPKLESTSNSSILSLASAGAGLAILPRAATAKWVDAKFLKVIEFKEPIKRKLFLVSHKNKTMNTSTKEAYALAKDILAISRKERDEQKKKTA